MGIRHGTVGNCEGILTDYQVKELGRYILGADLVDPADSIEIRFHKVRP